MDILAVFQQAGQEERIVLVKQYRPPMKGWTVEQPAGLIDAGETPEAAAIRELKVATGTPTHLHLTRMARRRRDTPGHPWAPPARPWPAIPD